MVKDLTKKVLELMKHPERIRNIGIIAHIHHGKTTLTDNLLAGAGMLAEDLAGEAMFTWWHEQERERELTIYGAAVSMVHEYENKEYLINLIDTPGHVEFSGEVTRALRATDGAIVVVDFVDGVMPQTEAVLRQALKERVKPVLFINKTDRAITELQLSPEKIMEKIAKIINDVNSLILKYAPKEFKDKWLVKVQDGSVAFGSAKDHWALSIPFMQKTGVKFQNIIKIYTEISDKKERRKKLGEIAPLHKVVLDMVIRHLPSPVEAQKYRIPHLWHGDLNSEYGKALLNCDSNGPAIAVVTKILIDRHAGEVATARVWSGTIKKGQEVFLVNSKQKLKVQQVAIYKGIHRLPVEEAKAGNVIALVGMRGLRSGETIVEVRGEEVPNIEPFEEIKHYLEPVVTKAVEPINPSDLPRLIEVLKLIEKEDPTVKIEINQETGEYLISGLGELHLEILEYRIKNDFKVPVKTSNPIVVYRETVRKTTPEPVEGKSPNKHNKFYIIVEPLPYEVYMKIREAIRNGELHEGKIRKEDVWKKLVELGLDKEEARRTKMIYRENLFIDMTRGIIHLGEVMDMVLNAFKSVMDQGPLAREPCMGLKVKLVDAILHEDPIHRGPGQVIPAVRYAIKEAMRRADLTLYEPVQIIEIDVSPEYMSQAINVVQRRRGQILDMITSEDLVKIKAKLPVAEMFGFTDELRSATSGRGVWFLVDQIFEKVPEELVSKVVQEIRKRKGLPLDQEIV